MNCWEFMQCERQFGGEKASELGICPAAIDTTLNQVNGGINAGRCCWKVAGTLCNGEVQGTPAQKLTTCIECEFFKKVQDEEGKNFMFIL